MKFLVFEDKPDLPPSPAQAAQKSGTNSGNFIDSVRRLLTNKGYILLLLSYGINVGVFYAISTLLNQVILIYFPVSIILTTTRSREKHVEMLLTLKCETLAPSKSELCNFLLNRVKKNAYLFSQRIKVVKYLAKKINSFFTLEQGRRCRTYWSSHSFSWYDWFRFLWVYSG